MAPAQPRRRRKYHLGRCEDCGHTHKPITTVTFWATGHKADYCAKCARTYRPVILKAPMSGGNHAR
jgi:hypothetical protein